MKSTLINKIVTCVFSLFFVVALLVCLFHPKSEISISERRPLAQFPDLTPESIRSTEAMDKFEKYALDQFPLRDTFRAIKAWFRFDVLHQKDNNNIYISEGTVSKLDYPLNVTSVNHATDVFRKVYDKYFKDTDAKLYFAIVPDKNYYLADKNGYPSLDYDQMYQMIQENVDYAEHIDLRDCLTSKDYYTTDTHWDQSKIQAVVKKISGAMGVGDRISGVYEQKTFSPFYGVYYGQSALSLPADTLTYLINDAIRDATVLSHENNKESQVYNIDELESNDPYNVFLSGSQPLLTITNKHAKDDRTLVVFRDSFGSSLTPLLIEAYSQIIVVDVRYVMSDFIGAFVDLSQADDVLFLYSSLVLNNSETLR